MQKHSHDTESIEGTSPPTLPAFPRRTALELVELADGDEFDLRIAPVAKRIGDATVRMLAYNGSIPGPDAAGPQGRRSSSTSTNEADLEATVHWHGLRLENATTARTRRRRRCQVGGTFTYRLAVPDPGVYWYHPHIREDYGQEMGLYGNIVVVPADAGLLAAGEPRGAADARRRADRGRDRSRRSAAPRRPTWRWGGSATSCSIGGETDLCTRRAARGGRPLLPDQHRQHARLQRRAARARMKLVGGDSGRYEREEFVDSVMLAPSERVVVDVLFEQPGQLTLEHRTPERTYPLASIDVSVEAGRAVARRSSSTSCAPTPSWWPSGSGWRRTSTRRRTRRSRSSLRWTWVCPRARSSTPARCTPTWSATSAGSCPKCGMKLAGDRRSRPATSARCTRTSSATSRTTARSAA